MHRVDQPNEFLSQKLKTYFIQYTGLRQISFFLFFTNYEFSRPEVPRYVNWRNFKFLRYETIFLSGRVSLPIQYE